MFEWLKCEWVGLCVVYYCYDVMVVCDVDDCWYVWYFYCYCVW